LQQQVQHLPAVLHVSTSDGGGAGKSALRLHQALLAADYPTSMLVLNRHSDQQEGLFDYWSMAVNTGLSQISAALQRRFREWRVNTAAKRLGSKANHWPYSSLDSPYDLNQVLQAIQPQIVHLHWVNGFVDWQQLAKWNHLPIVWTLHDMNTITGGCHYSLSCYNYQGGCPNCPIYPNTKGPARHFSQKRQAFQSKKIHFVAPSQWLAACARTSRLTAGFSVSHIPYGIDAAQFRPTNQEWARSYWGIEPDRFVLLFVSHAIDNPIKGFEDVLSVFHHLKAEHPKVQLIVVGKGKIEPKNQDGILFLGSVQDDRLMPTIYAAADVLLFPTYADNLPNTILEAMACELPVIAYKTGGVPDMVKDGENGFMVNTGDVAALTQQISDFMNMKPDNRKQLGNHARATVLAQFNPPIQASRYISLYEEIAGNSSSTLQITHN
jgi:glycosyltransferase involved in cell wall biosynthesis